MCSNGMERHESHENAVNLLVVHAKVFSRKPDSCQETCASDTKDLHVLMFQHSQRNLTLGCLASWHASTSPHLFTVALCFNMRCNTSYTTQVPNICLTQNPEKMQQMSSLQECDVSFQIGFMFHQKKAAFQLTLKISPSKGHLQQISLCEVLFCS